MNKVLNKVIWLIMVTPVIYLAVAWNKLPEKVGVHFDIKGNADKFGSKNQLLITLIITAVNIGLYLLLTNIHRIDRKGYGKENKQRMERIAFAISFFMAALTCYIIYNSINGDGIRFNPRIMFGAIGLLWCIMGNYMHTIKPNYFAGFRTRWTLNNEENWRKTHLLAGKLWFGGGLLIAIASLVTSGDTPIIVFISILLIITLIPEIYSYRLYKKQKTLNSTN